VGKWEMVRLGDVCLKTENENPTLYDKEISYIDISSIGGDSKRITDYNVISSKNAPSRARQKVQYRDILISTVRPNLNAVAIVDNQSEDLIASTGFCVLRPDNKKVDNRYLFELVKSPTFVLSMTRQATGASYPAVSNKIVMGEQFPLPPLEVQQQIADVLNRASTLIEKRKAQIAKLDLLIKSQFIEMFGDPVTNPKGWELELVGNCLFDIVAGWSVDGEQRERTTNEMAVLKVSAVTQGTFNSNEYKVIDRDTFMKKKITPQKGDLLFSRANTRELVGATCIIHEDYPFLILPDKLWKLKCQSTIHVYYLKYILSHKSVRNEMSANATGTSGSMYNISMQKLKNISIPLPPFHLQNTFAAFVECVEAQKALLQRSLEKLELNYKALMQKCFRGEIF